MMYLTGPWSVVYAVDLRTHKLVWTYDPEVPRSTGENACCDVVNRGVALYDDKIYVGSFDGRLISVDANTGEKIWEVVTVDQSKPYTITGAPRVVNGKVIIGNGGAELGVRGYFTAYDCTNRQTALALLLRFPVILLILSKNESMEAAAETWTGEWWKYGGGVQFGMPWPSILN